MNATEKTSASWTAAMREIVTELKNNLHTEQPQRWPSPVLYAEVVEDDIVFGACNQPALSGNEIVVCADWSGLWDLAADSDVVEYVDGCYANMYEVDVQGVQDAIAAAE